MTYDQAVDAVKRGLTVSQDGNTGRAIRIIVLFGTDYIQTDSKACARNFSVKHAVIVNGVQHAR
jgi:hypothetical protein